MDNASKALIIAGAVLIAVMLVSVGVMIYQNSIGLVTNQMNEIDSLDSLTFNQKITQYCGANKNATNAKTLVERICQINFQSSDREVQIMHVDETSTSDHKTSFEATSIPTGQNDTKVDGTNAVKITNAKNARYNIYYHMDDGGYIDAVEFHQIAGKVGTAGS